MHTIELQLEDSFYNDMLKRGVNLEEELKKIIKRTVYKKEYQIAQDIKEGLEDIKAKKTRPIEELLNEL
ncbi:MAG: hypothetical protein U9N49_07875 [Campylobacterota bacterium]|nr:hypothetical protein [Campylobacterota bacterium]